MSENTCNCSITRARVDIDDVRGWRDLTISSQVLKYVIVGAPVVCGGAHGTLSPRLPRGPHDRQIFAPVLAGAITAAQVVDVCSEVAQQGFKATIEWKIKQTFLKDRSSSPGFYVGWASR